jgi:hypothetical protein
MNKFCKISFLFLLIIFTGNTGFSRSGFQQNDTLSSKIKKSETPVKGENQNTKKIITDHADKGNKKAQYESVKRVKSARPDMSKARGARPPNIVRPTGSRIPNGIGRPAGALRPGHG